MHLSELLCSIENLESIYRLSHIWDLPPKQHSPPITFLGRIHTKLQTFICLLLCGGLDPSPLIPDTNTLICPNGARCETFHNFNNSVFFVLARSSWTKELVFSCYPFGKTCHRQIGSWVPGFFFKAILTIPNHKFSKLS